jgi:hypothetical protein
MRSRTEARWAAFFDALGWPWEYEPLDLDGYLPDFVLRFELAPLVVEIKPAMQMSALVSAQQKLDRSGWTGEAIVTLGAPATPVLGYGPVLGAFREREIDGEAPWGSAELFRCLSCGAYSPLCCEETWRCRLCDSASGNAHIGHADGALELWALASNRVQWRAPA